MIISYELGQPHKIYKDHTLCFVSFKDVTFLLGVAFLSHKIEEVTMVCILWNTFSKKHKSFELKSLREWRVLRSKDLEPLFTLTNMGKKVATKDFN